MSKKRVRLSAKEAEFLGFDVKPNEKGRKTARYFVSKEDNKKLEEYRSKNPKNNKFNAAAWDENGEIMSIDQFCDTHNLDVNKVKNWRLCTHTLTPTINVTFKEDINEEITNFNIFEELENIVKKVLKKTKKEKFTPITKHSEKALKVTTSDDHVGLDPNPNNEGLFRYEYNGEIYLNTYDKIYNNIIKEYNTHGFFDLILLDNLGDEQDGYNKKTTREGHILDQNMSNTEVFEVCVDAKVKLIQRIVKAGITNKVILRKVSNDNHSGDFGAMVNITVRKIINLLYSTDLVEVEILSKFLEHRIYGDHCFILTHGKDKKVMFKGLPLQLNDKTINFINDYISHYDIKSKYIHVEKGDLHQIGYNKCRSFDYRNFMSLAPPSNWVQHNFGDCYSGYSIQIIPKHSNEISHTDYFLDYKKVNN